MKEILTRNIFATKWYVCPICGHLYKTFEGLIRHVEKRHKGYYYCPFCDMIHEPHDGECDPAHEVNEGLTCLGFWRRLRKT